MKFERKEIVSFFPSVCGFQEQTFFFWSPARLGWTWINSSFPLRLHPTIHTVVSHKNTPSFINSTTQKETVTTKGETVTPEKLQ